MKFYDRKQELAQLDKLLGQTKSSARMTVLTGRRRVGKTSLSLEFIKVRKYLYFFVAKKSENLLCAEYLQEIKNLFPHAPIVGEIRSFKDIFHLLLEIVGGHEKGANYGHDGPDDFRVWRGVRSF